MEFQLITHSDFLPYRAISDNTDKGKRVDPHIIEAQRLDLLPLLGERLYYDLVKHVKAYRVILANYETLYQQQLADNPNAIRLNPEPTPEQKPFVDLLNGVTYIYKPGTNDEVTKEFPGVVPVLVYLSYARFVNRDNMRSTAAGFVIKTTMESQPISAKQITEEAGRAIADANRFFTFVEQFMRDKSPAYDRYLSSCACSGTGNVVGQRLHAPRNRNKLSRRRH